MSKKAMFVINEEDNSMDYMVKKLNTSKPNVALIALNLLHYILEQRDNGNTLITAESKEDKLKSIIEEATAKTIKFTLNDMDKAD